METQSWRKNAVLIPIVIAILASTGWSVYHLAQKPSSNTPAIVIAQPSENFFLNLYQERLREEGNRTSRVEKMIKDETLSGTKARYFKTKDQPR